MNKVKIRCPSCSRTGFIEISTESIKKALRGLIAINIAKGIICEHTFIAYIDKNLNIRDYFVADFQIEIPQLPQSEKDLKTSIPKKEIIDIDLIKLNIPATLLVYILKSIFSKQKIVLIFDQEFLYNHIYNFFNYITKNSFEINIIIITKEKYNKNKKNYKNSMVFEDINILRNKNKLINPRKLAVQKHIVNRFLTEKDLGYSYIVFKNEILKAYELAKAIVDIIKESKEKNESVNTLKINSQLEKLFGIKINIIYLKFLIEIVENYFGITVPSITDSFLGI